MLCIQPFDIDSNDHTGLGALSMATLSLTKILIFLLFSVYTFSFVLVCYIKCVCNRGTVKICKLCQFVLPSAVIRYYPSKPCFVWVCGRVAAHEWLWKFFQVNIEWFIVVQWLSYCALMHLSIWPLCLKWARTLLSGTMLTPPKNPNKKQYCR